MLPAWIVIACLAATHGAALSAAPDAAREQRVALLGVQNRAGDTAAAAVVDLSLRAGLGDRGSLLDPRVTRDAQRRLRLRNGDRATPEQLRRLAAELGAGWLVSGTLHDVVRAEVPRLTVSARVYSGATGELLWAGFRGGSGIDGRTLLGLGVVHEVEELAVAVVDEMLQELPGSGDGHSGQALLSGLGRVAIVPFAGSTRRRGTAHAETVTEAVRARLSGRVDLVSPNDAYEVLRRIQAGRWGGVTAETRAALRDSAGADAVLTGAVEAYAATGPPLEPNPQVAIAMRLLDAATGRIVWTGWIERDGRSGLDLFGIGRVHSRGDLTRRIVETLAERLERESPRLGDTAEAR